MTTLVIQASAVHLQCTICFSRSRLGEGEAKRSSKLPAETFGFKCATKTHKNPQNWTKNGVNNLCNMRWICNQGDYADVCACFYVNMALSLHTW
jgi:hypothetical protein